MVVQGLLGTEGKGLIGEGTRGDYRRKLRLSCVFGVWSTVVSVGYEEWSCRVSSLAG